MELTFEQINGLVFEAIQPSKSESRILTIIGEWYYRFVNSNEKKLTLTVPFYSECIHEMVLEYLYFFEIILKFNGAKSLEDFEDTFLFDIFEYSKSSDIKRKEGDFKLAFQKRINGVLFFDKSTVTGENYFLPVFKSESIGVREREKKSIYKLFRLFKGIRKSDLISSPILINLDENLLLSISANPVSFQDNIGVLSAISKGQTIEDLRDLSTHLKEGEPIPALSILYPYNTGISARIESTLSKSRHFRLVFKKRFSYSEINQSDIQLLPTEFLEVKSHLLRGVSVRIIDTCHSKDLFELFEELNRSWKDAQFNPYITPFPAKWFMCIHDGENLNFWKRQFEIDFPAVRHTLLTICLNIIEQIHGLNWIANFLINTEIKGLILPTSKSHQEVIVSLKKYIEQIREDVLFFTIDQFTSEIPESIVVLNGYNIIETVNWCQRFESDKVSLTFPDFTYFNHYSFFQYGVLKYQFLSIREGLRETLDPSYNETKLWEDTLSDLLREAKLNRSKYILKYKEETAIETGEEVTEFNELDFSESEVLEIIDEKDNIINESDKLIVFTKCGEEIQLSSQDRVIVMDKGFVTTKNAGLLAEKELFIPPVNIKDVVNIELIVSKLSQMTNKSRTWQVQLNDRKKIEPNLYKILASKGLDLQEYQFERKYLEPSNTPNLPSNFPKKLKNWKIISEFLGITPHNRDESWILYYGRSDLNRLKALYRTVLSILIEENLFGQTENIVLVNRIVGIVVQSGCFKFEDIGMSELEIAQSIIESIHKQLAFLEINRITVLKHG